MAKILVIDDDELVNGMMVQFLSDAGYEVQGAQNGYFGLKLLQSKSFDLVVTDILMPEKEGIETILAIRKKSKTLPIIVISGGGKLDAENYLRIAKHLGANYTFRKPFNSGRFLEVVQECLTEK